MLVLSMIVIGGGGGVKGLSSTMKKKCPLLA